jgi:23S rRNA (cytidine1920-2'-O)/16S rRNA (cytidine1409-2'-O)-methyltransferase
LKRRADLVLVERGVVETRAKAQEAIAAGGVTADGIKVAKASDLIEEGAVLELVRPHPWASRAGLKLAHALDVFGVDPAGHVALDVGASTGGFTDVLLTRGARLVYAVDVGRGQLHPKFRDEPRVVSLEGVDARTLTRHEIAEAPDLVVCDASFIGLAKVLPRPLQLASPQARLVALVKPQFEAGPGRKGKAGVVDETTARRVAEATVEALDGLEEFRVAEMVSSPVRGGEGAREFLVFARRRTEV